MRSDVTVLPQKFLDRLRGVIAPVHWDAVLETFSQPKPITFRVNSLKATGDDVQRHLEAQGFRLEAVSWYPGAFILRQGRLSELQETEAYRTGLLYVQSLSSLLPALVLDPQPGERVLDLTAAPGGKTTQMACLMRGQGEIVANDNNRVRYYKLRANVQLQGAGNVKLSRRYGESFGKNQRESFDRVLADVPCSTEGRFQVQKPKSYNYWRPAKIQEMARKQKRLLASGIEALRPGGVLVYATCTFAPEENEGVVSWALERFGAAIELEAIGPPLRNYASGLTTAEGKRFHPSLSQAVRILPTAEMEGFFMARIRKLG